MTADPPPSSLKDLEARLSDARQRAGIRQDEEKDARTDGGPPPTSAMGLALRVGIELAAGLAVGGGIGWFLDRWLGTSPFLLLVFFVLGAAAGMLNVYRLTQAMNAPDGRGGGTA
ncbi:MAG: AtpZ/AtpI family protein [Alphaproteobacteria bacterium]|nr:AtpZ/AtpI family protein [Alphaproteobacteria bacterium]